MRSALCIATLVLTIITIIIVVIYTVILWNEWNRHKGTDLCISLLKYLNDSAFIHMYLLDNLKCKLIWIFIFSLHFFLEPPETVGDRWTHSSAPVHCTWQRVSVGSWVRQSFYQSQIGIIVPWLWPWHFTETFTYCLCPPTHGLPKCYFLFPVVGWLLHAQIPSPACFEEYLQPTGLATPQDGSFLSSARFLACIIIGCPTLSIFLVAHAITTHPDHMVRSFPKQILW